MILGRTQTITTFGKAQTDCLWRSMSFCHFEKDNIDIGLTGSCFAFKFLRNQR